MKKIIVLGLMLVFILATAACGDSPDVTQSISDKTTSTTEDNGNGEVFIISSWNDVYVPHSALNPTQDLQLERLAEAEEIYGITVEYKVRPHISYNENFIAATLAGDKWCDLYLANRHMLPVLANNEIIYALDDYLDFDSGLLDNEYKDIALWAGRRYGYAWEYVYAGLGIWYNRDIFDAEGLEDPYEIMRRGEWTFDKFRQIAIELTKDTNMDGSVDQWGIGAGFTELANSLLVANMGDFVFFEDNAFRFGLTEPHAMEAILFTYDLFHEDGVVKSGADYDAFAAGEAAMTTHVSWAGGMYKNMGLENLGFLFLPKGPNADDYTSGVIGGKFFSVPITAEDPQRNAEIGLHIYGVWDETRDDFISFEEMSYDGAETEMYNQRDMETFFEMQRKQRFVYTAIISDLTEIVMEDVYFPLSDRETTPAQAIEAVRLRAQTAIDNVGALPED